MTKLSIDDINKLESWILKKCETLPAAKDAEYSDANLSRGIFQLLLVLLEEKRQECYQNHYHHHNMSYSNPHIGAPVYPFVYQYADATSNNTICATCKAQNPNNTHCIHRVQMGSPNNTGGKL